MKRFLLPVLILAGCAGTEPAEEDPLCVGVAKVEITPAVETYDDLNGNGRYDEGEPFQDLNGNGKWDPVWLAGFSVARPALGVHDPLWARAIVFRKGERRAAIVACDLIGLLQGRIRELTKAARAAVSGNLILCSTHVHSGPDTVGLWGPFPGIPGVSPEYLRRLEAALAEAVERAGANLVPVTLSAAEAEIPGVCKDVRPPDIRNERAVGLLARDRSGKPVAVLANFAMHPEGMGSRNRQVTSDYPHYVREALEREFPGATAVFVSADLGGMQTPDVKDHTWAEIERCGETIAKGLSAALAQAPRESVAELRFASSPVEFALDNRRFVAGFKAGTFGKDTAGSVSEGEGRFFLRSELSALRLGEILFVTVPGEALPEVGKELFSLMNCRHPFLLGLGQDEIGYILPKADFDPKKYEESMSLGPETAPTLLDALKKLLKGF